MERVLLRVPFPLGVKVSTRLQPEYAGAQAASRGSEGDDHRAAAAGRQGAAAGPTDAWVRPSLEREAAAEPARITQRGGRLRAGVRHREGVLPGDAGGPEVIAIA